MKLFRLTSRFFFLSFVYGLTETCSLQFIEEAERSLHDAIMIVRRALKNSNVVAGGGAIDVSEIVSCSCLVIVFFRNWGFHDNNLSNGNFLLLPRFL